MYLTTEGISFPTLAYSPRSRQLLLVTQCCRVLSCHNLSLLIFLSLRVRFLSDLALFLIAAKLLYIFGESCMGLSSICPLVEDF